MRVTLSTRGGQQRPGYLALAVDHLDPAVTLPMPCDPMDLMNELQQHFSIDLRSRAQTRQNTDVQYDHAIGCQWRKNHNAQRMTEFGYREQAFDACRSSDPH